MSTTYTVLVVDDEPWILAGLQRFLAREGYRVICTDDPTAVLGLLEKERVDVLISDIHMPEMSGIELVSRVRRSFPEVVRILLTAQGSLETALQAINDGEVHRYLTKPWDGGQIRSALAEALARLEELRSTAAVRRKGERRQRLLAELEREYPGIGSVTREDGTYVPEAGRLDALAERLRDEIGALLGGGGAGSTRAGH
jgi:two-component system, probable response regulator PhcQ